MRKIAVFASGFGSNFTAIQEAIKNNTIKAKIQILISDQPLCLAIERAKHYNIDVFAFNTKLYSSKTAYEQEILDKLNDLEIDLIVLAGYMRIIGPTLLRGFKGKILNIHPSILPNFKGKDAIGQAIESKTKVTGVTVHYVNEELDSGEIIAQEELDISNMKSRAVIEENIHRIEHRLYPKIINQVLEELYEKSTY